MVKKIKYTRKKLIEICERALVPESKWSDRDSEVAQKRIGEAWALLRAGCSYQVVYEDDLISTNDSTIWIKIRSKGFEYFEGEGKNVETFYLPTEKHLNNAQQGDWY